MRRFPRPPFNSDKGTQNTPLPEPILQSTVPSTLIVPASPPINPKESITMSRERLQQIIQDAVMQAVAGFLPEEENPEITNCENCINDLDNLIVSSTLVLMEKKEKVNPLLLDINEHEADLKDIQDKKLELEKKLEELKNVRV